MSAFTGTGRLVRFTVRRERVRIAVWVLAIVVLVITSAEGIRGIYPTRADLLEAAAAIEGNVAGIAFNGPVQGIETLGGRVAFETGTFGMLMVGLMSLLLITRLTRAEEESGRVELVRATVVGRHAPTLAALTVVTAMNVVVAMAVAASLVALDLPVHGSVVFGAGFLALGLVFAAIATITAQVSENTRVASGTAGILLGAAFVLRAVGDTSDGPLELLSWLSPIGWSQKLRPFAGERWWPIVVPVVATVAQGAVAALLLARRDVGGGLVAPRRGPASASPRLRDPLALALRMHRGAVVAWSAGVLVFGGVYGAVAEDVGDFVSDNEAISDILARLGGDLTDSFLGTSLLVLALLGSGFPLTVTQRLRTEETSLRVEPMLATPVSRGRWIAAQLVVAVAGTVVVLAAGGLGLGATYGIAADDLGQVPRLVGAALTYLPAVAVLTGIAVALFGIVPAATTAAWAGLVFTFVIGMFATVLDLPAWVVGLSPFERTPQLPADAFDVAPLLVLAGIAAALHGAGVAGFRRRDLAS